MATASRLARWWADGRWRALLSHHAWQRRRRRRLPLFLQMEANECGLACLAMVGAYHGLGSSLAHWRSTLRTSSKGTSLEGLERLAAQMGMSSHAVRLDLAGLPALTLPCVLHWDMDHYVVLSSLTQDGARIHDPAVGVRRLSMADMGQHFTGVALQLEPDVPPQWAPPPPRLQLVLKLGAWPGLRRELAWIFSMAALLELLAMALPLLPQWVVDHGLAPGQQSLMTGLCLGFAILVAMSAALRAARGWAITLFGTRLNLAWTQRVFAHLLRLPLNYFERRHAGHVAANLASLTAIQQTLTQRFIAGVIDGLMAAGTWLMLVWFSPPSAIAALAVLALYAGLRIALQRPIHRSAAEQIVQSARQQSHFFESLRGIQSVLLYGRSAQREREWTQLLLRETAAQRRLEAWQVSHEALRGLLYGLQRVALVWLAGTSVAQGEMTLGAMFTLLAYVDQFASRSADLVDSLLDLALLRLHVDRVEDIVGTQPENVLGTAPAPDTSTAGAGPLALSARGLWFAYAVEEAPVLQGVDLDVAPGECVALAGASGSGKTTLAKLLLGLHAPDAGEVWVDGLPLQSYGRQRLRAAVGTVMQDDSLFTGSISDNIAFFDAQAESAWVEECARMAGLHEEILSMPTGYATLLGEAGAGLSGGQKQRLLLARALYRRPRLLVLDEATSHLDVRNERLVNEAVRRLAITRIVIAHRPETLAMADRVVHFAAGKLVSTPADTAG